MDANLEHKIQKRTTATISVALPKKDTRSPRNCSMEDKDPKEKEDEQKEIDSEREREKEKEKARKEKDRKVQLSTLLDLDLSGVDLARTLEKRTKSDRRKSRDSASSGGSPPTLRSPSSQSVGSSSGTHRRRSDKLLKADSEGMKEQSTQELTSIQESEDAEKSTVPKVFIPPIPLTSDTPSCRAVSQPVLQPKERQKKYKAASASFNAIPHHGSISYRGSKGERSKRMLHKSYWFRF